MLDTQGYKQTLTVRNTYCLSTATIAGQTPSVLRDMYTACLVRIHKKSMKGRKYIPVEIMPQNCDDQHFGKD